MKRLVLGVLVWLVSLACLSESAQSWDLPLDVDVTHIKFNYDTQSRQYDGLTIRKNKDTAIEAPEWVASPAKNEKFAYIKGDSDRKVQAKFYTSESNVEHMHIEADVDPNPSIPIGDLGEEQVWFVSNPTSFYTTFTSSIDVPNDVNKRTFNWRWHVTKVNGESVGSQEIGYTANHTFYTLLDVPQSPWDWYDDGENEEEQVWTEVLDDACNWAKGETSPDSVATKITEGIYYMGDTDGDIDYDWPQGRCIYSSGTGNRTFNLTGFLGDINSSSSVIVNCSDVGNLFNIYSSAVGCSSQSKRIWNWWYGFETKSIDPIGTPGWATTGWYYHQYGWLSSQVDDACIRVNQGSPILPSNMSQSTYDGYLLAPGEEYTGSDTGTGSVY
jgi:hypothetical protein